MHAYEPHPLTYEEFEELDKTISSLGSYLSENQAPYILDNFNRLRGENEPRPCMCPSAGGHWKRATDYLRTWINDRK